MNTNASLYISENHMQIEGDDERMYRLGDVEPYEPYTDNIGRLFRSLQKEYGRCTGAVYIETKEGVKRIGWVFRKREEYSDWNPRRRGDRYYTREVWITLHAQLPERETHYHYKEI